MIDWFIGWLLLYVQQAVFHQYLGKEHSIMYKQDYIEMREGVGQSILPAAIKVRRVGSDETK